MKMNPYLHFNGNCQAAFEYYEKHLGGKITFKLTFGASPSAGNVPAGWQDKLAHITFELGDQLIQGSDCPPEYFQPIQGSYISLNTDDAIEAERVFQALAENGKVTMPFAQTFWAYRFGMAVDQFGTPWMINCNKTA